MKKIKTFSCRSAEELDASVNEFNATHAVFATQTNVAVTGGNPFTIIYVATVFYTEANK